MAIPVSLRRFAESPAELAAYTAFRMLDVIHTLSSTNQTTADNLEKHFNNLKAQVGVNAFNTAWRVMHRIAAYDSAADAIQAIQMKGGH